MKTLITQLISLFFLAHLSAQSLEGSTWILEQYCYWDEELYAAKVDSIHKLGLSGAKKEEAIKQLAAPPSQREDAAFWDKQRGILIIEFYLDNQFFVKKIGGQQYVGTWYQLDIDHYVAQVENDTLLIEVQANKILEGRNRTNTDARKRLFFKHLPPTQIRLDSTQFVHWFQGQSWSIMVRNALGEPQHPKNSQLVWTDSLLITRNVVQARNEYSVSTWKLDFYKNHYFLLWDTLEGLPDCFYLHHLNTNMGVVYGSVLPIPSCAPATQSPLLELVGKEYAANAKIPSFAGEWKSQIWTLASENRRLVYEFYFTLSVLNDGRATLQFFAQNAQSRKTPPQVFSLATGTTQTMPNQKYILVNMASSEGEHSKGVLYSNSNRSFTWQLDLDLDFWSEFMDIINNVTANAQDAIQIDIPNVFTFTKQ